jgi:hypothetical protein
MIAAQPWKYATALLQQQAAVGRDSDTNTQHMIQGLQLRHAAPDSVCSSAERPWASNERQSARDSGTGGG